MIIEQIKKDQLSARKTGDKVKASLLTTLIGEASTLAKNKNVDLLADTDTLALIAKFLKGINETLSVIKTDALKDIQIEKQILESYMPLQLSKSELAEIINAIKAEINFSSPKDIGKVMSVLKDKHQGQYDAKIAMEILKS